MNDLKFHAAMWVLCIALASYLAWQFFGWRGVAVFAIVTLRDMARTL